MTINSRIFTHENVNGVMLSLKVDANIKGSPNSRLFTVTYKNTERRPTYPKASLFFAILFNIIALWYVRISLTAVTIIFIVLTFLIFFWVTHSVQSENLLVVPTVGIQSSVKYVYGREDNFIPWSAVDDVIINEVIKLNRVLYYLTILIKLSPPTKENETVKLMALFKYTKPRLAMLEIMYSELQNLLTESQREKSGLGSGDTG